jgi:CubicO group peptidase (beta-lactamase class C family)
VALGAVIAVAVGVAGPSWAAPDGGPRISAGQAPDVSITAVAAALDRHLGAAGVPGGAVVVAHADGRIEARAVGDAGDGPATTRTPFVIGSTTKSFTALAIMQLVDSGSVSLDAPVRRYVPEFRLAAGEPVDTVTVRQLLQQTSGLPETASGPLLASARDGTALEAMAEVRQARLADRPGASWRYANINYVLAGLVVERASGLTYADYVQRRIFEPLGMSTSFTSDDAAGSAGLSRGHRYWFGLPVASGPVHREAELAAGYLITSAEDMGRYLAMYLRGGVSADGTQIVSPEALKTMLTPGPEATLGPWAGAARARYAMGWFAGGPWAEPGLMHPGNSPDSSAMITLFPHRGLAAATLIPAGHELPVPGNPAITDRISRSVVHAVLGEPVPAASSLRQLYLVFDLVALGLLGAAGYGLLRSLRRLRTPRRSTHPVRAWAAVLLLGLGAAVVFAVPILVYFGWAALWTWAPDLALVMALLTFLLATTAGVRAGALLRGRGAPTTPSPSPHQPLRRRAAIAD